MAQWAVELQSELELGRIKCFGSLCTVSFCLSFLSSLLLLLFLSPTYFAFCLVTVVAVVVVAWFEAEELQQPSLGFASQTSQAGPGERVFEARRDARLARGDGAWRQQFTFKRMQKYA